MPTLQPSRPLVVIAIGGNSLIKDAHHMSVLDQYRAAGETCAHIAPLVRRGYRIVITHGNGPQVGFILLRSELAKGQLHQVPLESCVADTQGAIGYQIAQALGNACRKLQVEVEIASVITQSLVDRDDPAFSDPAKPIGPFYTEAEAVRHRDGDGWTLKEDAGRGWRRVVPSPRAVEVIEEKVIRDLLARDVVVIALGGGGIPVVREEDGTLSGISAVIDKDQASSLLARQLRADQLLISTGVHHVMLDYGTPQERPVTSMTLSEAKAHLAAGQFPAGSMGPKIQAAIEFIEAGGKHVIITRPEDIELAVDGEAGTHIHRDADLEDL